MVFETYKVNEYILTPAILSFSLSDFSIIYNQTGCSPFHATNTARNTRTSEWH